MLNRFTQDVIKLYLLRGVISLSIVAFLSEYDVKDGMRATACLIHVGGSHSPVETVDTFLSVCAASCLFASRLSDKEDVSLTMTAQITSPAIYFKQSRHRIQSAFIIKSFHLSL